MYKNEFLANAYDLHKLWSSLEKELVTICKLAAEKDFMAGWSGNASARAATCADAMFITPAGFPKGNITPSDLVLLDFSGEILAGQQRPSSEWNLHARLYGERSDCMTILHTHPVNLQTLGLIFSGNTQICQNNFLAIELYETKIWKQKLSFVPEFNPGSEELAKKAAESLKSRQNDTLPLAVWLEGHGLCTLGKDLYECLALTEELEHLATVQLKYLSSQGNELN